MSRNALMVLRRKPPQRCSLDTHKHSARWVTSRLCICSIFLSKYILSFYFSTHRLIYSIEGFFSFLLIPPHVQSPTFIIPSSLFLSIIPSPPVLSASFLCARFISHDEQITLFHMQIFTVTRRYRLLCTNSTTKSLTDSCEREANKHLREKEREREWYPHAYKLASSMQGSLCAREFLLCCRAHTLSQVTLLKPRDALTLL